MSTKPETQFIARVHKHLPATLYRMKNNNLYHAGIADVWYSGCKGDLWAEYKVLTPPKKAETLISLVSGKKPVISHLQQAWLAARHHERRTVGVMLGVKLGINAGGVWFPGLTWREEFSARDLMLRTVPVRALAEVIQTYV